MPAFEEHFSPLFISQTYSQPKDQITFDYQISGNRALLREDPTLVPTRLMQRYPAHAEL